MIVGSVTDDGVPIVSLFVAGQNWRAVVDTGFNGDLELPDLLRLHVNARFFAKAQAELAAGQRVEEDCFVVDFPFDDLQMLALATFLPGREILVGTHLLRKHHLEIDFVNQTVRLERATS